MDYKMLSDNCGLSVSCLGFGTATVCSEETERGWKAVFPGISEEDTYPLLDRYAALGGNFIDTANWYAALGGNFIDTANWYGLGRAEEVVGRWLSKQDRDKFVISTKVGWPVDETQPSLSRKCILKAVEETLQRLQTDYIDLYSVHVWDSTTPILETLSTLNDLVRVGKVRYVGASNMTGWQLQKCLDLQKMHGFEPFVTLQQQYSLMERISELEAIQVCKNEGLGVLCWSPLRSGFLAGKCKREMAELPKGNKRLTWTAKDPANNSFFGFIPVFEETKLQDKPWQILSSLKSIGKAHGKTEAQVALRWLVQRKPVSSVLLGVEHMQDLEENMGAAGGWALTNKEMDELNQVSATELPYPYGLLDLTNKLRQRVE